MEPPLTHLARRNRVFQAAFTLIEMIGVLTVIAVLAAVLLPALIKQADKTVADQETAALQSFGASLQNYILRNRRIPADGAGPDWATNLATEAGLNLAAVTNNFVRQPRIFLIDTNGFRGVPMPYNQTSSGLAQPTNNPRLIILSSLGKTLPALSSRPATADFNNLWNSTPTAFPTTGAWTGWTGNPYDVVIQRINLAPLFVQLVLTANNSTNNGNYRIDFGATNIINAGNSLNAYFLQNSVLTLYSNAVVDSQQILQGNVSFVFDQNVWRSSLTSVSTNMDPPDYSGIVNSFNNSSLPSWSSGPPYPSTITADFIAYMNAYNTWANDGSNFANNSHKSAALNAYNAMMTDVNALVINVQP